jgi:hypothetical protein
MFSNSLSHLRRFVPSISSIAKRGELPNRSSIFVVALSCATLTLASSAQTFTTLLSFAGTNGASPQYGSLIQGIDPTLG